MFLDYIKILNFNSDLFNAIYLLIFLNFCLEKIFNEFVKNENYQTYFIVLLLIFDVIILTYFNI